MLAFVATDDHQYTFRGVLETRKHDFGGGILLMSYADFLSWERLPAADYIFVDLERLPEAVSSAAETRFAALEAVIPGTRVLNRPGPQLARLRVMARLRAAGVNRFRVMSAHEVLDGEVTPNFPVFVRRTDDHDGPMSALIGDAAALNAAIETAFAGGIPTEALAVTEYIDARNEDGHYEKLSYFRVGARLFPSALDMSRNWVCKGVVGDPDTIEDHAREQAFLAGNPHAEVMALAFDAAEIGYGRADYAMVDGRPQVFEINTNPLIDCPEVMPPALRDYARLLVERWLDALAVFSPPAGKAARWMRVPGAMPRPAPDGGHRLRRAIRGLLGAAGQLHEETRVMRPLRAARIAR
jgi:hypothetical protein